MMQRPMTVRVILLLLLAALSACSIARPPMGPATAVPSSRNYLSVLVESSDATERQTVQAIVDATLDVIGSERFGNNLRTFGDGRERLWLSPFGSTLTAREVAQIYLGEHNTVRPVPILVSVEDQNTPEQGFSGSPLRSHIALTPEVLARWRSGTIEGRSCAVNTLAHEISHSFSRNADHGEYIFADRGKGWFFGLTSLFYGHLA